WRVNENGFEYVVVIDPQSSQPRRLPLPHSAFGSIESDGADTLFFAAASSSKAAEVSTLDLRTDELRVLKRSLELTIDDGYVSKPEPIAFPTEKGQPASPFFYPQKKKVSPPPGGKRPPLIVVSHGGPTSATTAAPRFATQYWTSRGFAIVDVNYGGST